jgi:hypothetical protein
MSNLKHIQEFLGQKRLAVHRTQQSRQGKKMGEFVVLFHLSRLRSLPSFSRTTKPSVLGWLPSSKAERRLPDMRSGSPMVTPSSLFPFNQQDLPALRLSRANLKKTGKKQDRPDSIGDRFHMRWHILYSISSRRALQAS